MATKAHLNQVIASHLVELRADETPDTQLYIFERGENGEDALTYADLYEKSNKIARLLLDHGIGKGDTFGVFMRNYPEFIYSLLAGTTVGAIMVPIDPRNRGDRLKYLLNNCNAKAVITAGESLESFEEIADGIPSVKLVSVAYRSEHGVPVSDRFHALNEILDSPTWERVDQQIMDVRHPMQIIYTSGTTGDPKGVTIQIGRAHV